MQIEDSEWRILVFTFCDHITPVSARREGVTILDSADTGQRNTELGVLQVRNVVDVISACPSTIEPILSGIGMISYVEVMIPAAAASSTSLASLGGAGLP